MQFDCVSTGSYGIFYCRQVRAACQGFATVVLRAPRAHLLRTRKGVSCHARQARPRCGCRRQCRAWQESRQCDGFTKEQR